MSTAFDLGLVAACAFIGAIGAMLVGFRLVALLLFGLGAAVAFVGAAVAIGRGRHRKRP